MGAKPLGEGGAADGFARAPADLGRDDDLCAPFLDALPVAGAVISTLGPPLGSQTVCATNATAARIDEIQIDYGEGPCWDALRTRLPVLTDDLQETSAGHWPNAGTALRELHIGALFSFPLLVGHFTVGSLDLYTTAASTLRPLQVVNIVSLAALAARRVLQRALDDLGAADGIADGPYSRREVHQASGMVAARMSIGVDDAALVLRGHAFAEGRSVRDVAADVVARRSDLGG